MTVLLQRHYAGLGRWGLEATVGCKPFQFFSSIYAGEGWSLILSSPRMTVAATNTAWEEEEEEEGAGSG
jgi:hypothetical protein